MYNNIGIEVNIPIEAGIKNKKIEIIGINFIILIRAKTAQIILIILTSMLK